MNEKALREHLKTRSNLEGCLAALNENLKFLSETYNIIRLDEFKKTLALIKFVEAEIKRRESLVGKRVLVLIKGNPNAPRKDNRLKLRLIRGLQMSKKIK